MSTEKTFLEIKRACHVMLIRDISDFRCALALFICFCGVKQGRNKEIRNVRSRLQTRKARGRPRLGSAAGGM